ncbi:MAG: glycolate oxidase subunit GlcE [Betaproteobacteria bacterium]|nr:glycolate oxidase subunit GlcE [Betaproteobacteria bacterium]
MTSPSSPLPAGPADPVLLRWRDRIRAADAAGAPLQLHGGATKAFYGEPAVGDRFDTREYRGIVAYEPTELVVTARCGTPLAEVQAALDQAGQMLAFEPPAFGAAATVGGMVAAGLSGPRRASAGAVRDFVLGACLLDARGQWLRFGGQVMKNVAGYDVSRLLCGSLGVLGLITEVSLKVLPRPARELTLVMACDQAQALSWFNQWAGKPLPVSATAWSAGELHLRLSGAAAAVSAAVAQLGPRHGARGLDAEAAASFWADLREHRHPALAGEQALWRVSVPSVAPPLALAGEPVLEWGGALRWYRGAADAAAVRAAAAAVGGSASLFRPGTGGPPPAGVFHPLPPVLAGLHARLKREFDPNRIFNPGRLYPDL